MSNCIKTIKAIKTIGQILDDSKTVAGMLINADAYYAHIPHDKSSLQAPETLHEHVTLVQKKFALLAHAHHTDALVDKMILHIFEQNNLSFSQEIAEFIKTAWVNTVVFHDYGKVNENFQGSETKMNNPSFKNKLNPKSPLTTHHSKLGAYLYVVKHFENFVILDKKYHKLVSAVCLTLSYSILKHHGKLGDGLIEKIAFCKEEVACMQSYIKNYQWQIGEQCSKNIPLFAQKIFKQTDNYLNSFALYSLIRLSFSMLTASDFLASGEYCNGLVVEAKDLGVLERQTIEQIYKFVSSDATKKDGSTNFNKAIFDKSQSGYSYQNPQALSNTNLNILREEMGIEVLQTIRANADKNLFYIEAPTGGGKTNLSFLAAIELLRLNNDLNKVFYVFPFTTLVTQTQKSLIDTFGLSDDQVICLSSKSGFKEKINQQSDVVEDDKYGSQKMFYLDNLFCFFPFCLLTHIKFFNILKTNEKEENYLLHRLAGSVVVLDELQAYNPTEWEKVIYFIKNYAHFYNIKFVVMSATLPKIGDLKIRGLDSNDFVYLIDDAKKKYFKNPNFAERVSFDMDLFDAKNLKLDELAELLIDKSRQYGQKDFGTAKPLGSVYTIIEFIFKKSATEFYSIIKEKEVFFDEVFVLSGSILEHRRKLIINYLKNKTNRQKKILLITTQVVEAGVDIDMDLGFKNISLLDSDEQLAGRINRNINKKDCVLYLFNYNKASIIYGKDKRYEHTKQLSKEEYFEILKNKNFDRIYDKIIEGIEEWNNREGAIGFDDYEQYIKKLQFQKVHYNFELIKNDQKNITVFIPLCVPVGVGGVEDNDIDAVFSGSELAFLSGKGIWPNGDNKIEGNAVFDLYLGLINQKDEIMNKKIDSRILQGIISKFIIQIFGGAGMETKLIEFSDFEKSDKGYMYLSGWEQIYSEEQGIDESKINAIENQFL